MHTLIKISSIVAMSLMFFANQLKAQDIELGAGLGYGTQIKAVSYNFRAFYKLKNGIQVGPEFHFSFKNNGSNEFIDYALKRKEYSIQGKYVLENLDLFNNTKFYPIVGLSLINLRFNGQSNFSDNPLFKVDDDRDLFVGAYCGLGAVYELKNKINLFGEARYHISKESQALINIGIIYPIHLPFAE